MADYHPLITRAVSALEKDTAENRRVLYERARTALVTQLRGTVPPLDEGEITRERLALEEAIRKVEVESARRAREAPPPEAPKPPLPVPEAPKAPPRATYEPPKPEPVIPTHAAEAALQDEVRPEPVQERMDAAPSTTLEAAPEPASQPSPPPPPEPPSDIPPELAAEPEESEPVREAVGVAEDSFVNPPPPAKAETDVPWPDEDRGSRFDEALKKIREVAGSLSRSAEVGRRKMPSPMVAPVAAPPPRGVPAPPDVADFSEPTISPPPPLQPTSPRSAEPFDTSKNLPSFGPALPQEEWQVPFDTSKNLPSFEPPRPQEEWRASFDQAVQPPLGIDSGDAGFKPPAQESPVQGEVPARRQRAPRSLHSLRRLMWLCILLVFVFGGGALAYWQGGAMIDAARNLIASFRAPPTQAQKDTPPSRLKNTDRIGQPDSTQPARVGTGGTQRAMLTTEPDASNPAGKDYVGSANWKIEMIPPGPGRAAEVAIKLEVEIPDRGFGMTWLIKRNTDPTLPATHTVDIEFKIPDNSPLGAIAEIRSVLMKQPNQTEGQPLWGHAQKSTPTYFLIGLSANPADAQYNLRLLKEQGAFDIALVFTKARRAFLLIEKGPAGERVFADAFAAWKQ